VKVEGLPVKFRLGRGERFAVVPYKYRLFLTAKKAPSSAKDIFYSLCQILNSEHADDFRDIPQTRLAVENGVSQRQVERGIAWLKGAGLVVVKKRPGYPTCISSRSRKSSKAPTQTP
jgi:DNA-binding transcriptional ArsR family regulator